MEPYLISAFIGSISACFFKIILDLFSNRVKLSQKQKIELYSSVSEALIDFIFLIERKRLLKETLSKLDYIDFNKKTMLKSSSLALFSTPEIYNGYDDLVELIFDSFNDKKYSFEELRKKYLIFQNKMRKDLGIYSNGKIEYKGRY